MWAGSYDVVMMSPQGKQRDQPLSADSEEFRTVMYNQVHCVVVCVFCSCFTRLSLVTASLQWKLN